MPHHILAEGGQRSGESEPGSPQGPTIAIRNATQEGPHLTPSLMISYDFSKSFFLERR